MKIYASDHLKREESMKWQNLCPWGSGFRLEDSWTYSQYTKCTATHKFKVSNPIWKKILCFFIPWVLSWLHEGGFKSLSLKITPSISQNLILEITSLKRKTLTYEIAHLQPSSPLAGKMSGLFCTITNSKRISGN